MSSGGQLDPGCIFCRIIRGEIPCNKVVEDATVLAFLDVNPLAPGHTLVVPRQHAQRLHDLPLEYAAEMARHLGVIGRKLMSVVNAAGYNVLQNNGEAAGQVVPHVHFHIIPRHAGDGLGHRWNAKSATKEELAGLAEKLRSAP